MKPTLREILEGYRRLNAWELEEHKRELSGLSVKESLTQFFELCDLAWALSSNEIQTALEQDKAHWIVLRNKLKQAAEVMRRAKTT